MKKNKGILQNIVKYKHNSILIRNFGLIMVAILAPMLTVTVIVRTNMNAVVQKEISEANLGSLIVVSKTMDSIIDKMFSYAYYLTENAEFRKFSGFELDEVSGEYSEFLGSQTYYNILIEEYIDSAYTYLQEEEIVFRAETGGGKVARLESLDTMKDISWKPHFDALQPGCNYVLCSRIKNDLYPYCLTLIRSTTDARGAVVVNVDMRKLSRYLGLKDRNGVQFYMVGREGELYYSNMEELFEKGFQAPEYLDFVWKGDQLAQTVKISDISYVVSVEESEIYDCKYVLCTPNTQYENRVEEVNGFIVNIFIIVLILGVAVTYLVTVKSFAPIQYIMNEINGAESEGLTEEKFLFYEQNAENELQYITGMVRKARFHSNKFLLETEEWMKKLNDAQMIALQSQINPHYLYNTLDMINWDAVRQLGCDNNISKMITTLAQFLRMGLQRNSYLIRISEELEHAKLYLRILEARYEGTIHVEWDISEEILNYKTVRLTLQPLIENAVNHGLRPKQYKGNIMIRGGYMDHFVCLVVEDDGVGMDREKCITMNFDLIENYDNRSEHVGIRNVNQRIKILFGDEFGVNLNQREGGGLEVRMLLPKLE